MAIAESNRSHRRADSESEGASSEPKAALIERLRQGDVAAFDAFIREHWPRLFFYLLDRVRMRDVAEDIAQETLARLWERRRTLDASSSVVAWLYQTARHLAVDELRKIEVRRRWRDAQPEGDTAGPPTPLQVAEHRAVLEALRRALDALPDRRREAFTLVHIHNLSVRDAAEVMGNAPQTVANQVAAAVAELRRVLKPYLD
jgi:RNA polymerase sigma-70 factor (ECF subfamily)